MQYAAKLIALCRNLMMIEDAIFGDGPLTRRTEKSHKNIVSTIEFTNMKAIFEVSTGP